MAARSQWRGAEKLEKWRGKRSQQAVADLIGIDLSRYNAWENNRARPGLEWAVIIERVSGGAVAVESWIEESRRAS